MRSLPAEAARQAAGLSLYPVAVIFCSIGFGSLGQRHFRP